MLGANHTTIARTSSRRRETDVVALAALRNGQMAKSVTGTSSTKLSRWNPPETHSTQPENGPAANKTANPAVFNKSANRIGNSTPRIINASSIESNNTPPMLITKSSILGREHFWNCFLTARYDLSLNIQQSLTLGAYALCLGSSFIKDALDITERLFQSAVHL